MIVTLANGGHVFFDVKCQRHNDGCRVATIAVLQMTNDTVVPLRSVSTSSGARSSLVVPKLDRLFVAVRAGALGSDASTRIYRPQS